MRILALVLTLIAVLFCALIVLMTSSCNKEPMKTECGIVWFITEIWADSAKNYIQSDTTWQSNSVVCGQQFQNDKIMAARDTIFFPHCVNGVTEYWEKHIVRIK